MPLPSKGKKKGERGSCVGGGTSSSSLFLGGAGREEEGVSWSVYGTCTLCTAKAQLSVDK